MTVAAEIETLEKRAQDHQRLVRFHRRHVRYLKKQVERLKREFGITLIIQGEETTEVSWPDKTTQHS